MLERILRQVKPGSIILFHNAGKHTPETVTQLLPALRDRGFPIVPISELLLKGETYIDHTGRQYPKKSSNAKRVPKVKIDPGMIN